MVSTFDSKLKVTSSSLVESNCVVGGVIVSSSGSCPESLGASPGSLNTVIRESSLTVEQRSSKSLVWVQLLSFLFY